MSVGEAERQGAVELLPQAHPNSAAVDSLPRMADALGFKKRGWRDSGLHVESADGSQPMAAGGGAAGSMTLWTTLLTHTHMHTCSRTHKLTQAPTGTHLYTHTRTHTRHTQPPAPQAAPSGRSR